MALFVVLLLKGHARVHHVKWFSAPSQNLYKGFFLRSVRLSSFVYNPGVCISKFKAGQNMAGPASDFAQNDGEGNDVLLRDKLPAFLI
jgi:hypothetical protein